MKSINDDDNFETINGRQCLKDGARYRTSLQVMDAKPNTTDDDNIPITTDAGHAGLYLHKPGFRILRNDHAGHARVERAYQQYETALCDAYKQDAVGEGPEGSACTVRNAQFPSAQGQPGHIRGGICVPDVTDARRKTKYNSKGDLEGTEEIEEDENGAGDHRSVDMKASSAQHQDNMASLYDQLDSELREQWRNK